MGYCFYRRLLEHFSRIHFFGLVVQSSAPRSYFSIGNNHARACLVHQLFCAELLHFGKPVDIDRVIVSQVQRPTYFAIKREGTSTQ